MICTVACFFCLPSLCWRRRSVSALWSCLISLVSDALRLVNISMVCTKQLDARAKQIIKDYAVWRVRFDDVIASALSSGPLREMKAEVTEQQKEKLLPFVQDEVKLEEFL